MDVIEKDHPKDCKGCCIKMFSIWLDSNDAACWEDITTATDNLLAAGMYVLTVINFYLLASYMITSLYTYYMLGLET